eukprot:scaffold49454_cov71-Phaeocystis_antarctica.AAC.2
MASTVAFSIASTVCASDRPQLSSSSRTSVVSGLPVRLLAVCSQSPLSGHASGGSVRPPPHTGSVSARRSTSPGGGGVTTRSLTSSALCRLPPHSTPSTTRKLSIASSVAGETYTWSITDVPFSCTYVGSSSPSRTKPLPSSKSCRAMSLLCALAAGLRAVAGSAFQSPPVISLPCMLCSCKSARLARSHALLTSSRAAPAWLPRTCMYRRPKSSRWPCSGDRSSPGVPKRMIMCRPCTMVRCSWPPSRGRALSCFGSHAVRTPARCRPVALL